MSDHAVTLDERHFRAAEEKARALGTTPDQYLQSLIDADSRSFDDILRPVRQGFEKMSGGELDELFDRAKSAARQQGE